MLPLYLKPYLKCVPDQLVSPVVWSGPLSEPFWGQPPLDSIKQRVGSEKVFRVHAISKGFALICKALGALFREMFVIRYQYQLQLYIRNDVIGFSKSHLPTCGSHL